MYIKAFSNQISCQFFVKGKMIPSSACQIHKTNQMMIKGLYLLYDIQTFMPAHSGWKRQFFSIRVILQKVNFLGKNYFFYEKFGTRITSYEPHFCQPNKSWDKNVSFDSFWKFSLDYFLNAYTIILLPYKNAFFLLLNCEFALKLNCQYSERSFFTTSQRSWDVVLRLTFFPKHPPTPPLPVF
jgi:hypothetical protein